MAITLVQASVQASSLLQKGVLKTIVKESPVLQRLPFVDINSNTITYAREASMPEATFYQPGDTWLEATPVFNSVTARLTIIGADADVDNFIQATYSDPNDLEAEVIASRAKSVAYKYSDSFFNGSSSTNPKSFDGLNVLIPANQRILAGTNGGALTLAMLDELIDRVRPGKPDCLAMSKRTRRQLKALRRASGVTLETTVNQFGEQVETYDGIPILVDDFILDTETVGTGTNLSSVYALKFGIEVGVTGLQNGSIQIEPVGELETKDATRTRVKWYCGMALFSEMGAARLTGITA